MSAIGEWTCAWCVCRNLATAVVRCNRCYTRRRNRASAAEFLDAMRAVMGLDPLPVNGVPR